MDLPVQNDYGFQWAVEPGGSFTLCSRTVKELPPGGYSVQIDNCGRPHFQRRDLQADELIDFPDSLSNRILGEIDRFWGAGDRFRRFGFLHRRGYLFYGRQGCGKSSLIHQIVSRIIAEGHVAFFCEHPYFFISAMQQFRQVEPARPIVCIFEDIDAIIKTYGDSHLLQWLDGNHQVDRAVNLASTNYPERLDKRIISRPRRFDRLLKIDAPEARFRDVYFARKLPELSGPERRRWVELTEGLQFAALSEMLISVCCLGNDLEETATLLQTLERDQPSSSDFGNGAESNGDFDQDTDEP